VKLQERLRKPTLFPLSGTMDDGASFSPYVENGTAVFNVTDSDLCQFVKTVQEIESSGYSVAQGIFKVSKLISGNQVCAHMLSPVPSAFTNISCLFVIICVSHFK